MSKNKFASLGLSEKILSALLDLGYEAPSPIQEESIPILLNGQDVLAQAQTGTGKTAAFALPILMNLSLKNRVPQAIILAPTRELAIQVAESFQNYSSYLPEFHVLPIYGGQDYNVQFKALKRGVHVVVGTPGRVMDHLRRGTLSLDAVKTVVLDEADEMLKMGFIDDVKCVLDHVPQQHQTCLFSATIPSSIRQIANQYLKKPVEIRINPEAKTVKSIEQHYMLASQAHKAEALTRFLEVENFDAVLIFTRTKLASAEVSAKLEARGYAAAALNGDMNQKMREQVILRVKSKAIDILVATDVAARGLDIDRISHVVSYDIPYDAESYVHRIGRTGRAGRSGCSLLLVTPREERMLKDIEKSIHQAITPMPPPSVAEVYEKRAQKLATEISAVLAVDDLEDYRSLIKNIVHTSEHSELDIAAALLCMSQKERRYDNIDEKPRFLSSEFKSKKTSRRGGGGGGGYRHRESFKDRDQKKKPFKKTRDRRK